MTFKIERLDWQYLVPIFTIVFIFIWTDLFRTLDKIDLAYFSGRLLLEPYRGFTSHLLHFDLSHLFSNVFGIVVARYFLKELKLTSACFFLVLVLFLIPLHSFLQWFVDIYIMKNQMSLLIGFSGTLYSIYSFILLSSIYGKRKFLNLHIDLTYNSKVSNAMLALTGLGICFSLFPKISLSAHLTGIISVCLLLLF